MKSPRVTRRRIVLLAALLVVGAGAMLALKGCASTRANRNPVGELFPRVVGEALDGPEVVIPDAFLGGPVLLLVGYVQDAQFDADRWLLGLLQAKVDVPVREVPTIEGLMPGILAGTIDSGMRRGIPSEDWASVVTVYGDAARIVDLTGNTNPKNIRAVLLDAEGRIAWFHDRGYSAGILMELKAKIDALRSGR